MNTEDRIHQAEKGFIEVVEEALLKLSENIRKDLIHQEDTAYDQLQALPFWRFAARRRLKDRIATIQASRFIVLNSWSQTSTTMRKSAEACTERLLKKAKERAVSAKGPKLRITHGERSVLLQ